MNEGRHPAASSRGPVAAIDCGSHSTRLLIEHDGRLLVREIELTRLAEGLHPSGELQPGALTRVYDTLGRYRELMTAHGVVRTRIAATSAVRDATNRRAFVEGASAIVGTTVEVLDGRAEGELTFAGATADLDRAEGPFLVVDIGGGSTEFAFGTTECEAAMSLDIGSVRLSEMYIENDPPRPEELSACVTVTGAWLDDIDREMPQAHMAQKVIGVAGTFSAAVAVELGLAEYDREAIHGFRLTREAAEDVFRTLATEKREDRAANPGLPPGRVDTIVGGMSILVKVMRHFDLSEMVASESDILDGLARSIR
jgi:exopolyphosphatase/guanosine-5'-triphosphate,3'-diphosphate pyrophosphatase